MDDPADIRAALTARAADLRLAHPEAERHACEHRDAHHRCRYRDRYPESSACSAA